MLVDIVMGSAHPTSRPIPRYCVGTFVLAISVAAVLFSSCGSTALGEEQGSQAAPILEPIEWTDIWVTNANRNDLPRVLLVGDSITRGYFKSAEKLKEEATERVTQRNRIAAL